MTAPISNGPATTRLHHYAGHYSAAPVDNGARPQYPQTTGVPSPSKFRMQFPHDTDPCTLKNRRISTIRLQHLKYTQGNCMRNCRNPVRTQHHATIRPHWCGGHRQGLAGQRVDAPSEARGADGSRAGRRPLEGSGFFGPFVLRGLF